MATRTAVLVTRPQGQQHALCQALEAQGFQAYHAPMLEILPLDEVSAGVRQSVMALDSYQHIIFISTNAVRFGMDVIDDSWPQSPVGVQWYGVGKLTAAELKRYGIAAVAGAGKMTTETLLAMPGLDRVAGQRVLIVKGEGGRQALADALEARGARVDELPCYRRRAARPGPEGLKAQLEDWRISCILISSGEGLENLLALLSGAETLNLSGVTVVAPSSRVARLATDAGIHSVLEAENASDAAMLEVLQAHRSMLESNE